MPRFKHRKRRGEALREKVTKILIFLFLAIFLSNPISIASAASGPTISITSISPATGAPVKGLVTINGIATANLAGTGKIGLIGVQISGVSKSIFLFPGAKFTFNGQSNGLNSVTTRPFGTLGLVVAQWQPSPAFDGKFAITFDTTQWPIQDYDVTLLVSDTNEVNAASNSLRFTLDKGPITTLSPVVKCTPDKSQLVEGKDFWVDCVSDVELNNLETELQYRDGKTWKVFAISYFVPGLTPTGQGFARFNKVAFRSGSFVFRVYSKGTLNQISTDEKNTQIRPFTSNVFSVKFKQKTKETATKVGPSQKQGQSQGTTQKQIPVPNFVGVPVQKLSLFVRSFPGVHYINTTLNSCSISDLLSGRAQVIDQSPQPGMLRYAPILVTLHTNC